MTKSITLNIEQRENFLQLHNKLQRAVRYMEECKEVNLSDVGVMEQLVCALHTDLKFSPKKEKESDGAMWWEDYVLGEDSRAYKNA
tara:strand:- start:363 stop:620 length:258 start_codon:yes stop_codon:yes gene_type:complete